METQGQTQTQTHIWEQHVSNCLGLHVLALRESKAPLSVAICLPICDMVHCTGHGNSGVWTFLTLVFAAIFQRENLGQGN